MTTVTLCIKDESKTEDVLRFLSDIDFLEVQPSPCFDVSTSVETSGSKLSAAFGIWKDKDISLNKLRVKAWR